MTAALASIVKRLEAAGRLAEDTLLVATLMGMLVMAVGQIVLRNLFDTGFVWSDELLRLMLLWLAITGAVAASRENKHIKIDVLSRFLPLRLQAVGEILIALFAAAVCGVITWHALRFVADSRQFGDLLLTNTPAWYFQSILPLGFALITYRYSLLALRNALAILQRSPAP